MDLNDFVKNFAEQLEDTDISTVTSETVFKDLPEWCSMTALSIIAMIDEVYDVSIGGNDIQQASTIKDLFEKVSALKG